jgi:hypothetical protein
MFLICELIKFSYMAQPEVMKILVALIVAAVLFILFYNK